MQNQALLPCRARHLYPRNYSLALSLVAGHGFQDFPVGDTPGTKPVDDFLNLRRPSHRTMNWIVRSGEPCPPSQDPSYQFWDLLATTRVLDLRVAATLWSIFGVSWSVLFTFYALVSTVCCAMIFAIARRLSGSNAAGLASAALFLASPLESYVGAWSIRDASPAWFAIASCWLLVCVVGRCRSRLANGLSYLGLGAITTIGLGWRLDALLWLPYFGLGMILLLAILPPAAGQRLPRQPDCCCSAAWRATPSSRHCVRQRPCRRASAFTWPTMPITRARTWRAWRTAFRSIAAMLKRCSPPARWPIIERRARASRSSI